VCNLIWFRSSLNHSITNATTNTTSSARSSKCQSQYDNFTCDPINEQSDSSSTEQLAASTPLASTSSTSTSTSNVNLGAIPEATRNKDNSSSSERSDPDSDSHNHHHHHVHIEKTKLKNRPSTLVRRQTGVEANHHQPTPRDSIKTVKARTKARAIFPCTADQDDELSFEKGQLFVDVKSYNENDGWYYATMELNGRTINGLVPGPFIEFVD
jgi:hypothetical protein